MHRRPRRATSALECEGCLVTVTSYGYTANCRYIDGLQRVDIAGVQDWLAEFGVFPAAA